MPRKLIRLPNYAGIIFVFGLVLGGGLTGCSTSADVSYGEYRFGPGYETGRVYENRVYADTQKGFGRESCRSMVRRETDVSGRPSSAEASVCD